MKNKQYFKNQFNSILKKGNLFSIIFIIFISATICNGANSNSTNRDYTSLVNTFIGTRGSGNTFSGPAVPSGMVQLTPYVTSIGKDGSGTISGFQHTNSSGSAGGGNGARGEIIFLPIVENGPAASSSDNVYKSAFSHQNEIASPGYYRVILDDYNITAELSATTRAGFHKYIFPKTSSAGIVLNLYDGSITMSHDEISGYEVAQGNDTRVYFAAKLSKPAARFEFINNGKIVDDADTVQGKNLKGIFRFKTSKNEAVLLKVALSSVSVEGARKNLEKEIPAWDFDLVKANAQKLWNKELGKIDVTGGTKSEQTIFYTALYHSLVHPNIYMDVDRQYRSTDGKVYTAPADFDNYTTFSLWDTFRGLHPLYTIINQERTAQFIKSFVERYEHKGRMLIMEFRGGEGVIPAMIGYHSLSVLADAYVKGIRDYDVAKAYKAMVALANDKDREGKELYMHYGYIPSDLEGQSVSRTLEYSYNDWCVTRLAKDFSDEDYLYFSQRGDFYKNVFSKEDNFMRGRQSNFQFVPDFDPMVTINHYTEANAYQYSTFVPQDVAGLIELMGGDKNFEQWLDDCFSIQTDFSKINVQDVTGLIGQYAHGNEPSHHIAYLYDYVGTPWKTQKMVRQILSTLYTDKADGIDGNEDCGQMSAWYVLSAMGFYSVTPGQPYYAIGSPVFDTITFNLENGNTFEIIAKNNGAENVYIQSAELNGKPYTKTFLNHQDIMNGGKIVFEMANKPNKKWGVKKEDRPYAPEKKFKYAKAPKIEFPNILFLESTTITMSSDEPGAKIYYTVDGTEPTAKSIRYTKPITITESSVVKTKSFVDGFYPSYTETVNLNTIEMLDAVKVSGELAPGIKYVYKEGDFGDTKRMKNFPSLGTGFLEYFHVNAIKDQRQFGYNFDGYLKVPATGVYNFSLEANDGAILFINDKMIIDNDGGHRAQRLDTKIGLQKGWHPIKVDYFQQGLAKSLFVTWEGPGVEKQEIPKSALYYKK